MLPLTDTADDVDPAVLCLVTCVRADLVDTNVLLHLTENLALLHFAATFELGTRNNPMVRNWLVEPFVEVGVSFEPTDLTDVMVGGTDN